MPRGIRDWLPLVLPPAAIFTGYVLIFGLWHATTLLSLTVTCFAGARMLQEAHLRSQPRKTDQSSAETHPRSVTARRLAAVAVGVIGVQLLLDIDASTFNLLADRWLLLTPLVVGVAAALILGGTPRVHITDTMQDAQILNSVGAAWLFFLGYLQLIFEHTTLRSRFDAYFSIENIRPDQRSCCKRLVILLPMNCRAMPSDTFIPEGFIQEKTLAPVAVSGIERNYGATNVYKVDNKVRFAMETATPLRVAALAVEDKEAKFDHDDYTSFVKRFKSALEDILAQKPLIEKEVLLVPIYNLSDVRGHVLRLIDTDGVDFTSLEQSTFTDLSTRFRSQ